MTLRTIDSDAHVLEIPRTWEFMPEADRKYAPIVVAQTAGDARTSNDGKNALREYWVIDGRLQPKESNVGHETTTSETREMRDIDARLKHMDELEIDIQVLYPTLFLRPITLKGHVETPLVQSYNRWLGDIWKKGKNRLRWVAMPPLLQKIGRAHV